MFGSEECGIYEIQLLDGESVNKDLIAGWLKELEGLHPKSLFQSPEYFDFLVATERPGDLGVALVTAAKSEEVCGVIPIRQSPHALKLSVGKHVFGAVTFNAIRLLGSLPNMPPHPQLFDDLAQLLMQIYPDAEVLCLESVPVDSWLWRHITTSKKIRKNFYVYLPHGPRRWYSIGLPTSFKQYLERFSAKQRYNLSRQVRRLQDYGEGLLNLHRIASAEQVKGFVAGMQALANQQERTAILRPDQYVALAQRGLLLSFVLVCGVLPCAIAFATHHGSVLQVHTLFYDRSVWHLSPGTAIQYLIVQNVIETGGTSRIEFGYGPGTASTISGSDATAKGQILLMRKSAGNIAKKVLYDTFCAIVYDAKGLHARLKTARLRISQFLANR